MLMNKDKYSDLKEKVARLQKMVFDLRVEKDLQEILIQDLIEYLDIEYPEKQKIKFIRREHNESQ